MVVVAAVVIAVSVVATRSNDEELNAITRAQLILDEYPVIDG